MSALTLREYNGIQIPQRHDGYINATAMCQAGGKQWSEFRRLKQTEDYVEALESVLGIPRTLLIVTEQAYGKEYQGTWVHPRLASRLAQWVSAEFAVVVDGWVIDITTGVHPMPNEVSHEGAIAKGIAALMESQSMQTQLMAELVGQSKKTIKKIDDLTEDVAYIDDRLKIVEHKNQKMFTKASQRVFKRVLWKYFDGCCPIYPHIRVLQSVEKQVITSRNRSAGQFDHFYAPHNNGLTEGWLVSAEANQEFRYNPAIRQQYSHRFQVFQDWARVEHESEYGIQLKMLS